MSTLTSETVTTMRCLHRHDVENYPVAELARMFNANYLAVYRAVVGKTFKEVPFLIPPYSNLIAQSYLNSIGDNELPMFLKRQAG